MQSGKIIEYRLQRKIHYLLRDGTYLENNDQVTGFIIDHEFKKLINGEELIRTVDEADGEHGFNTVNTQEKTPIYIKPFFNEETGYIKDNEMMKYPFEHAENISIKFIRKDFKQELTEKEQITLIIKTH